MPWQAGLPENTLVVLLSDHGCHLGECGWWNKTTLYQYTLRTPLIVYAPDMNADADEKAHADTVNRLQTMLEKRG